MYNCMCILLCVATYMGHHDHNSCSPIFWVFYSFFLLVGYCCYLSKPALKHHCQPQAFYELPLGMTKFWTTEVVRSLWGCRHPGEFLAVRFLWLLPTEPENFVATNVCFDMFWHGHNVDTICSFLEWGVIIWQCPLVNKHSELGTGIWNYEAKHVDARQIARPWKPVAAETLPVSSGKMRFQCKHCEPRFFRIWLNTFSILSHVCCGGYRVAATLRLLR